MIVKVLVHGVRDILKIHQRRKPQGRRRLYQKRERRRRIGRRGQEKGMIVTLTREIGFVAEEKKKHGRRRV